MNQNRRWRPAGMMLLAAMLLVLLGTATEGVAQVAPTPSLNPFNDQMQRMQPADQAARLASHLGLGCIGIKPFFMGVTKAGKAKGYAYWSVGAAYSIAAVSLVVSYVDTTAGAKALFYDSAADGRWAGTVIWRF